MALGYDMKPRKIVNIHAHLHVDQDVPERIREWRSHGCVKSCVLACGKFWQPPNSSYMGNDDVLQWMREFPDIIVGMGALELGREMDGPDEIDRLKESGFEGLKFLAPSRPYDHDRYMPLYERAEELDMPILFHTGWVALLEASDRREKRSSEYMRAFRLDRVARTFPRLKIIGAHLGLPHADEALKLLASCPNVYFDMCGGGGSKRHQSLLKKALAPFPGADWDDEEENLALKYFRKMVFGTDNPTIGVWYPAAENVMDYLRVPDETRELFYWRNAADIFGWDP